MKVLFWVDSFPTVSETFIRNQIIDLINEEIEVFIFCASKNKDEQGLEGFEQYNLLKKTNELSDILPDSKIDKVIGFFKIFTKSLTGHNFLYFLKFIWFFVTERKKYPFNYFFLLNYFLTQKIDVIHCHFGPLGKKAVFLKKIRLPIKLICTFHGYDIRLGIANGKSFYKDLFKYADSIISISNYNKEKLISFGLKREKIEDLNNGVEVVLETYKNNSNKEKVNILSVGRLVEEKGYYLALNAISVFAKKYSSTQFRYDIVGGGILEKKLKKECSDLGIDSIVKFHLSQNSEYVKNKMLEADFLFLPSINEAIPTVILEAQSYSLPVLATNVGSVNDLVIDDVTGFLSNVSEIAIVEGLEKMFNNKEKWEIYGSNAKKNIILNFDRTELAKKLIKIYKK